MQGVRLVSRLRPKAILRRTREGAPASGHQRQPQSCVALVMPVPLLPQQQVGGVFPDLVQAHRVGASNLQFSH